ncbi:hypothetical protein [Photorhabdus bodei]|uniref:Lipoprotein n=1 Tax=Photorhabdus bodei TaxID=2029681 RepID=A0ABX0ARK4_9GAMM|nr:hypothetical protein [Photorhabdus bodei]NDL01385.1 hypothetical protein [Photorhabdus bodei]NDL05674.1 hypothetical protein [Photorhabdus bodei]NDL09830.1 hypothetical protein [Photorhabdus bodei]
MTWVSECSQQRGSLKDDGYIYPMDFKMHCDGKGANSRERLIFMKEK